MFVQILFRFLILILFFFIIAFVSLKPAHALVISPTFETGLSVDAENVINTAIGFYERTFSDSITVNIDFHNLVTGKTSNLSPVYFVPYSMYRSALIADSSSVNDTSSLFSLPYNAGRDPILGNAYLDVKSADGRAVGFNTSGINLTLANTSGFCAGFNLDGCIGLNVSNMTSDDLLQIVEHQIDQVLGLGSSLGVNGTILYNQISPEDLFRYAGVGSLSFALNLTCPGSNAYFSIDQGVTFLDQFNNCSNGFGYGDFTTYVSSQVQTAYVSFLPVSNLLSIFIETVPLDVIGYNILQLVSVPEPDVLLLLGLGLLSLVVFRYNFIDIKGK